MAYEAPKHAVLVASRERFPIVKTLREWEVTFKENGDPISREVHFVRHFVEYQCYMTPEEASFLVEDESNQRHAKAGKPMYWYPAGIAVPRTIADVEEKTGEPFMPPKRLEAAASLDPRTIAMAEGIKREQQAAISRAVAKKKLDDAEAAEKLLSPSRSD